MRFKHTIIKEVMVHCESKLHTHCLTKESFVPMSGETVKSLEKEIKRAGWRVLNNKTICPRCSKLEKSI